MKLARRATGRSEIIAFVGGVPRTHVRRALADREQGDLPARHGAAASRRPPHPLPVLLPVLHACARRRCDLVERELRAALRDDDRRPRRWRRSSSSRCRARAGTSCRRRRSCRMLRKVCDEHGIMLVADEVQSGFGRTGRMFAVEHTGVEPDIMCLAKALGNGMPIAAIVARHRVMSALHEGEHGTTYGGNADRLRGCRSRSSQTLTREHDPGARGRGSAGTSMERVREWQADDAGARRRARPRHDDRARVHAGRRARRPGWSTASPPTRSRAGCCCSPVASTAT